MKTTADFLDALRAKLDLPSDNALGKYLGIHRQHISHYRNLRGTFDDETSIRIAEILGEKPAFVMACMHHQRAKNPEVKAAWKHTAEMLYGLAAALAFVALLPGISIPDSGLILAGFTGADSGGMYIMSNCTWLTWLIIAALVALAVLAFPYNRAPKKRRETTDKLSGNPPTQN